MVKTIAHLADIHIRKLHRFVEYRQVFKKLYKQLKDLKPDVIYIGGDVVHGKLDTSPEEVRMVANFFLELCKIAPTIIIPGNHDCNLNNKSREDTLSPIVDLVQKITPNLHYWKKTGVYTMDNVDFATLSIFDIDKEGKQRTDTMPSPDNHREQTKIALFHGGVDKHFYDNGFQVQDDRVTNDTFAGYDMVLLGDIHKRQFLNEEETIAYPGSLIQQNYSEEPSHGFLLWDVEKRKATYHQVENDYGYKILNVVDGEIQNSTTGKPFELTFMPPKGRVKIKFTNTTLEQIKDIQIGLRKQYPKLKEIVTERQDNISIGDDRENKLDIGDVRDVNYQNELIEDFLKRNVDGIDEATIKRVQDINDMTNNSPEIYDGDITRNVDWKIKSFEFDNMFCYGKGNKIDFTKLDGTIGVVAPNHSGKSAIMDAIAYTIYDVCSRTNRALDVMNKKKTTFRAKLNLEINGMDYWIERDAKYKRVNHKNGKVSHQCPVKVKFYMIDDSGEEVDLSGAARFNSTYGTGTNEEIKKVLGTFDDFILTSLSLQTNGMNFLDKKQAERKKILSTFMDIEVFEQLETIAKSDSNEERIMLRQFQKKDSYKEIGVINQRIGELEKDEQEFKTKDETIGNTLFELEDKKIELVRKLYKIDETYDIEELQLNKSNLNTEKSNIETQLKDDLEYKEQLRPMYMDYHKKLSEIDEEKIQEDYENWKESKQYLTELENKIKLNESKTKSLNHHNQDLMKFTYDENCEFCIKNGKEQIHEQEEIQNKIKELFDEHSNLTALYKKTEYSLQKLGNADERNREFKIFSEELNQIQHDAVKIGGKISTQESRLKHIESDLKTIESNITRYYELEEKIENNNRLNDEISTLTTQISNLQLEAIDIDKQYKKVLSTLSVAKNQKQQIEDDIQKLVDIEQKILDYDLYLMALSKDGVPYELISKAIPSIEREINNVLENMNAGFHIELEMKDKMIDAFICYGEDKWNLELSSGMERFVSSLAIRIGLINVSTLPRPNFIIVDEGFGALDSDNIANMQGAFQYLRTQFDFTMIITHLDTIKDYMDTLIPINVNNGLSKVVMN
jgi:DNA repair exonuclease SbcCD ATPase subunit